MRKTIILFVMILVSINMASAHIISGSSVYVNDSKVYLSANPHIMTGSGYVYVTLNSKQFTGNIDFAIGVDSNNAEMSSFEVYQNITDTNGTYEGWKKYDLTSINYTYDGKNVWHVGKNFNVNTGKEYMVRFYLDIVPNTNGKYDIAIKPSSETIAQSISNNHFYILDPWWNMTSSSLFEISGSDNGISNNACYVSAYTNEAMCQGFKIIGNASSYNITNMTFPLSRNYGAHWTDGTVIRAYILNFTGSNTTQLPNETALNGDRVNNTFANSVTEIPSTSYTSPINYTIKWNNGQVNPLVLNNTMYYACVDANGGTQQLSASVWCSSPGINGFYPYGYTPYKISGVWNNWGYQCDFYWFKLQGNGIYPNSYANESAARTSIEAGINNALSSKTIYYDQRIYTYTGTYNIGRFDIFVVSGNKRWAFNYLTGNDTYTNMQSIGTTLNIWENTTLTAEQIATQVETFINATKV